LTEKPTHEQNNDECYNYMIKEIKKAAPQVLGQKRNVQKNHGAEI
jgi:hypothetical protein